MKNIHVTDLDIQQFAFDQNECEKGIIKHIYSCQACHEKVKSYLVLSSMIKNQVEPSLDYDLSMMVINQLTSEQKIETSNSYVINFILITLFGFSVLTLVLFSEIFLYFLNEALSPKVLFAVSIVVLVFAVLVFDEFRSYNTKLRMLSA